MNSSGSGIPNRVGEYFLPGTGWDGKAFKLDSATSMWTTPTPTGTLPGDIAVSDDGLGIDIKATAFVKHNYADMPSEIDLRIIDAGGSECFSRTFSAPFIETGMNPFCRYPAVEVTYSRADGENNGRLWVHVVWSQLRMPNNPNWELYYKCIYFRVLNDGVHWDVPCEYPVVAIRSTTTLLDEFQPDLALEPESGDLFIVYNLRDPNDVTHDMIMCARHPNTGYFSPIWDPPYMVSGVTNGSDTRPKSAPKLDVGLLQDAPWYLPELKIAAVWSELYDEYTWQVYYNEWDPYNPGNPTLTPVELSSYSTWRLNALPQVDITPNSSAIHQAIATWFFCSWDGLHYGNFMIRIAATPYLDQVLQVSDVPCFCPDIACYQMNDPDEHWFGLSFYEPEGAHPWPVWVRRYNLALDWYNQTNTFSFMTENLVPDADAVWQYANPFTGSSLCLREPDMNDLALSWFGFCWIDYNGGGDESFKAYITRGYIKN
jgi:hypothetical protein